LSSRLSIGAAQTFRTLTVLPLVDAAASPIGWLTLDQAIERRLAEVTELSDQGAVPQLKFLNRGSDPVFLLDGEELVGAKQNRILNLTILAPGQTVLNIPVSCVEQGRWSWRSRHFKSTDRVIYPKLRRRSSEAVSESLDSFQSSRGNQGEIWNHIAMKSARMAVHSVTGSASALLERYGRDLDKFVDNVTVQPGQVGAAFLVDGRFAGLDLLGGPDLLPSLLPKLVRSYAVDVLENAGEAAYGKSAAPHPGAAPPAGAVVVRTALDRVGRLAASRTKAAGEGEDLRFREDDFVGSALIVAGSLAHLSLWAADYC
jgi:hypothetical protein